MMVLLGYFGRNKDYAVEQLRNLSPACPNAREEGNDQGRGQLGFSSERKSA
jgi:hypothetical protein